MKQQLDLIMDKSQINIVFNISLNTITKHWHFSEMQSQEIKKSESVWVIKTMEQHFDVKSEARRLFRHLTPEQINREQTFLNQRVKEIEIGDKLNKWTVLRTRREIEEFIKQVEKDFKCQITNFDKEISQLINNFRDRQYFKQFFQIEFESFRKIASIKMKKKSGPRYAQKCFCQPAWLMCKEKQFIITKDGILQYNDKENKKYVEQNIQFTSFFSYEIGQSVQQQYGIVIKTNYRNIRIKATNFRNYFNFVYFLNKARKHEEVVHHFRYDSFAPVREKNQIQFIIDGEDYFRKVAEALENAKIEVLISGWWVSPQIYLRRDKKENYLTCRLDQIIKKLAEKDVKVYIIVYWESSFLSNESAYTQAVFKEMGPNVKIIRHPDIVLPSFWSHHEKLVIIDQQMAFVGGIDLCYGRYDNKSHSLDDNSVERYPGVEYNNARIKDFSNLSQYKKDGISRDLPRLPWHDVSVFIVGQCVKDICNHFIEYWNFVSFQTKKFKQYKLVSHGSKAMIQENSLKDEDKSKESFPRNLTTKISSVFSWEKPEDKIKKEQRKLGIRRNFTMIVERQNFPSAGTLMRAQQPRRGSHHFQNFNQMPLKPISQKQMQLSLKNKIIEQKWQQDRNLEMLDKIGIIGEEQGENNGGSTFPILKNVQEMTNFTNDKLKNMGRRSFKCQILRSASKWSIGCRSSQTQISIQAAYLGLIQNAKRFIYIENQYFISSVRDKDKDKQDVVENQIAITLFNRIKSAHQKNEPFYVIVILPLIPAFPGEISGSQASIPRGIMHWQYRTIQRHKTSLFNRISEFADPSRYIKFYSLRTHGLIYDTPHTEILYVHTKLLIVDDEKVIIGSANINDRSLHGDRDSEVCVLIQGDLDLKIVSGSQKIQINETINHLREDLWQQHFGVPHSQMDPLNEEHRKNIEQIAKSNTQIYRKVFGCYPDDSIKRMKDISKVKSQADLKLYSTQIKKIRGHVVEFPLQFLASQSLTNLTPDAISI